MTYIILITVILNLQVYCQVQTDSFKVLNKNSSFTINASGFALGKVYRSVDPFYHASFLLHTATVFNYGSNIKLGLRFVSEVRNFSEGYDNRQNTILWAKPFIWGKFENIILDSTTVLAGDQWRIKHGQGLFLDDFEGLGATFRGYQDKFELEATLVGVGYNYYDDLYKFSLGYNNIFRLGYIFNFYQFSYDNLNLLTLDFRLGLYKGLTAYSELGYNPRSQSKAGLLGINYNFESKRFIINSKVEYRHYDKNIWNEERPSEYQYFYSLTAIDKPMNNYYLYIIQQKILDVLAARVFMQLYIYKQFYAAADLEPGIGSIKYFAYKTELGYEIIKTVKFKIGVMNKFFSPRGPIEYDIDSENFGMFRLSKRPWVFAEATFKL